MGRYSSDSDSPKRSNKNSSSYSRSRYRSSSSSSSESTTRRKVSSKHDRHSRSRKSPSTSYKHQNTKYRKSSAKDRPRRSKSRQRRSRSRSYIREYSSKKRASSSSSSSPENVRSKTKREEISVKKIVETKVSVQVLEEINEDKFNQKSFSSSKSKKVLDNIVIDLRKQTIKVPEVEPVEPDSIFHHNLFVNEEARMEKWIKELYGYRQRALQQGLEKQRKS